MNSTVERVKPEIHNGIEFYVSADKSIAGCSQSGLARLCGIPRSTLQDFLAFLSNFRPAGKAGGNFPETLLQKDLYLPVVGTKGAKILKEEACVALVEYYAFYAIPRNETALYSYRKFAAMGWHNWVLSVCGHSPAASASEGKNDLADAIAEIKGMVNQLALIGNEVKKSHPGLVTLVERYGRSNPVIPKGLPNPFTYMQWAKCCGYDPHDHFLIRRIAEHVKALRGKRELRKLDGCNVYFYADLPAFESAVEGLALKRNQALLKEQIEPKRV